ncbi:MAG: aspartate-semialdehyde dehydrogenase [Mageeibacillus sp.]|jgi:aspartate-semialdehyde dehydrogenase|nr:aspartate-semialdehyde dehydrogenase [Mageeibacillus sp.]MCI1264601.1 aspartate-semialdehyde dehydrogenase [Saccharofermentans sp.]MCI1769994.1 aspartate-semialdehyde dehydrogenase [Mageeibacillus sp.]MCI2044234.1 aspartate-semialdehyde dehydrogenase [Mageeibacillus sp.]
MGKKLRVGVIGATGYVGQRFVSLLENHPWFECVALCASPRSAGKTYEEACGSRWKIDVAMPEYAKKMVVYGTDNIEEYCRQVDFTFCAVDMKKDEIRALEEKIARLETPVVSNNSANRWTSDVPMIIPEINSDHAALIDAQRKRLNTSRGFIAVKPNCSIQSYVPALTPFRKNGIKAISLCTYQAISGAGKTFADWPEMVGNVIPYIGGEEEKSEKEPLKVWGKFAGDHIELAGDTVISAQCYRVAVQEGHTAAVSVTFENKPSIDEMIKAWSEFESEAVKLNLPSAPKHFIQYIAEDNRPQPKLDAMFENGMGVSVARLREDNLFDYKFACLSHNTLRGAAGGGMLTAELLTAKGYITAK